MPCGGIYPGGPIPPPKTGYDFPCWVCRKSGAQHFCDEWDTPIHARCVPTFLQTEEGRVVIKHKHTVYLDFSLEEKP